jgi:CRISPR/Cas system CSM-associated protein Csm3 (group 7 of RAMP superfamily)
LEEEWGAAAREAKFDEEIVAESTRFEFRCTYEGDGPNDEELLLLKDSLRALQDGELRCGAKSSIGYGRVQLHELRSRSYQRNQPGELKRFLRDRLTHSQEGFDNCLLERAPATRPILCWKDAPGPLSHFEFDMRLYFHGNFLSKDSLPPTGYPHADAIYFLSQGRPVLKGSSLRGVLRDRASHIQRSMGLPRERFETLFGTAKNDDSGRKSRLETWEGVYLPPQAGPRDLLLDHVAVDRISGFAADGAKFAGVALSAPAFDCGFRLSLAEDEADLLALWGFVLRDLLEGFRLQAGWAVSRGYGEVAGAELRAVRISLVTAHGVVLPPQPAPPDRIRIELGETRFEELNWCWTQAQRAWDRVPLAQAG